MMDRNDFMFIKDFPHMEPLVRKLLKRYAAFHYDDIWVVIDIIYRCGYGLGHKNGVKATLEQLMALLPARPPMPPAATNGADLKALVEAALPPIPPVE